MEEVVSDERAIKLAKAGIFKVLDTSNLSKQSKIKILRNLMGKDKNKYGEAILQLDTIAKRIPKEDMRKIEAEVEALKDLKDDDPQLRMAEITQATEALEKARDLQDRVADRSEDIRAALRGNDPEQRAVARRLKKGQRKIKVLSTRVDNLENQKRAIVLNLFREYEIKGDSSSPREIETLMMLMANLQATEEKLGKENILVDYLTDLDRSEVITRYLGWAIEWKKCAFARLSVGAKLGAALMLTDAPDEVVAPWNAWSLCVPDGIIKTPIMPERSMDGPVSALHVKRLWCYGTEPVAAIAKPDSGDVCYINNLDGDTPWIILARNFVKGACLSLAVDVEKHRNKSWGGPKGSKRAPGVVPDAGVDYVLSGSVAIDLRDEVKRICEGRKTTGGHGGLTVQFLVRGHWRNQAVGIRHSDRKRIWIEPFWKGPEESRVLLRTHRIKTDGEE